MFVLLMIPKQSSNKSAHGWHAKYFYRNEFRSYIFQSDTGPSLSLCSRPLFTFLSLIRATLLVHSWRKLGYNLCFRKYSSPYLQADDSLVPGFALSALESLSYEWPEWKVWRKPFQGRYFDVACHRKRSHQYPNLSWTLSIQEQHDFKELSLSNACETEGKYVTPMLYMIHSMLHCFYLKQSAHINVSMYFHKVQNYQTNIFAKAVFQICCLVQTELATQR